MTKSEIEAFLAIVQHRSISAASEALYISQPALSRRLSTLEKEIGYTLCLRTKDNRKIELTYEGSLFQSTAEKWISLWQESHAIAHMKPFNTLNLTAIGSVTSHILPGPIRQFVKENPDCRLTFHSCHSEEGYNNIESGAMDIAFISNARFSRIVDTIPIFKEKMVLATHALLDMKEQVHPSELNPTHEIRIPWNAEFDIWHDYWFGSQVKSRMILDQLTLLEYLFLDESTWAIIPESLAQNFSKHTAISIHDLAVPPPERVIYYLLPKSDRNPYVDKFLKIITEHLSKNLYVHQIPNKS